MGAADNVWWCLLDFGPFPIPFPSQTVDFSSGVCSSESLQIEASCFQDYKTYSDYLFPLPALPIFFPSPPQTYPLFPFTFANNQASNNNNNIRENKNKCN